MICVVMYRLFFFFKQKTAYEMRISDWSSDVCSSDLQTCHPEHEGQHNLGDHQGDGMSEQRREEAFHSAPSVFNRLASIINGLSQGKVHVASRRAHTAVLGVIAGTGSNEDTIARSEEHTSELQSLMLLSYAVFCLKKQK